MRPLYLIILLCGIFACQDDDAVFNVNLPVENIRFEARPGGAMMYYRLPADKDVFSVNIRYVDCRRQEVLKTAGYGGDSLLLDGFNEAVSEIPVRVSLVSRDKVESEPVTLSFSTEASAPFVFLDDAQVLPSWNGFQVVYKTPSRVSGKFHVFYVGTNPFTLEEDTVLIASNAIMQGGDTLLFSLQQDKPFNTVVIRTEDHRGMPVKQKMWKDIEAYNPEKLNADRFVFMDVENKSISSEEEKAGIEYLFDGDVNGAQRARNGNRTTLYTFIAGPNAQEVPFIIDLKEGKIPAQVRIYGILRNPNVQFIGGAVTNILNTYESKLPCDVTVYGGNSSDLDGQWVKLGSFKQAPKTEESERWSVRCTSREYSYTFADLETAEPAYLEIIFPAKPVTYRYLKLVINDTFDTASGLGDQNLSKYITMQELEIYVKK